MRVARVLLIGVLGMLTPGADAWACTFNIAPAGGSGGLYNVRNVDCGTGYFLFKIINESRKEECEYARIIGGESVAMYSYFSQKPRPMLRCDSSNDCIVRKRACNR